MGTSSSGMVGADCVREDIRFAPGLRTKSAAPRSTGRMRGTGPGSGAGTSTSRGRGLRRDGDPGMDVRRAVEVPGKGRALELPDVPDAIVSDVTFFKEAQPERIDVAEAVLDLRDVEGAEGESQ